MSGATKQEDWTKPSAMAIPEGGFFKDKIEQGRYGPIFPKIRHATASRSSRRSFPDGKRYSTNMLGISRRRWPASRTFLPCSSCTTCAGSLPDQGRDLLHYQGIFDTDFDKYTEDAVALFGRPGQHRLRKPRRLSRGLEDESSAFVKFVRDHQCPSFLEYGEYPFVSADEIKKALELKAAFRHARPDAVIHRRARYARVRRYPAHPADPYARAHGAIRISFVS